MTICRNSCLLGVFVLLASYSSSAMDNVVVPSSAAQPGKIFEPAVDPSLTGFSPLDPNGDGWITSTGVEFSDAIYEDSQEFENGDDWRVIWHYQGEPTNDLGTGATCGATEIVDNPNTAEHAAFFKIVDPDGDLSNRNEKLVFRIRVASESSGAFG